MQFQDILYDTEMLYMWNIMDWDFYLYRLGKGSGWPWYSQCSSQRCKEQYGKHFIYLLCETTNEQLATFVIKEWNDAYLSLGAMPELAEPVIFLNVSVSLDYCQSVVSPVWSVYFREG